jgi:hypothetical protein
MEGQERPPVPSREDSVASGRQPSLDEMREQESRAAQAAPELGDDDPVWTWNAPVYVTGDSYGVAKGDPLQVALENLPAPTLTPSDLGMQPERRGFDFSVEEKRERAIAHFSVLADLEELKGGPTHFRVILSVGPEVSNREMKALVNAFLGENFPETPAFVAIHRDTEHTHAHLYVHLRQLDGKRLDLGQRYFQLDESWMRISSERLGDKEILDRHMKLKAETLAWKEQVEKAREEGQPLPPKPDRWSDHKDTELSFRPWSDQWCGRIQAQTRVAEAKVQYLTATGARDEEVAAAREEAERLRGRLEAAERRRAESRSEAKSRMPAEVVTISEARKLLDYEREIERIRTEKAARPERQTPARPAEQRVLQFEQPRDAQVSQLDLDFGGPVEAKRTPGGERAPAGTNSKQPPHGRDQVSEARTAEVAPPPVEEAARSFGRELVAEARLAFTEQRAGESRSRKEQRETKGRLAEATKEYAAAREEAQRHRASLHERGVSEPPYRLEGDEQRYLGFVSKYVDERLREHIKTEVARSQAVPKIEEEPVRRGVEEPAFHGDLPRTAEPKKSRGSVRADKAQEEARQKEATRQRATSSTPRPEVAVKALPDDEAWQLVVRLELARARAVALHVEEADFKATPQYWVSPAQQVTLAQTEAQIEDSIKQGKGVRELNAIKERLQSEIAVERARLPSRREEAEKEVRSLEERLNREADARGALNLPMPSGDFTPEALRELTECAERARDPRMLNRAFEIERGQALRDAKLTGDAEHVRRLEEKYAGVEFKAEVSAHRRETTFTEVAERPEKVRLPAKDVAGRDTAVTLEQLGGRGGLTGLVKRAFESGERRRSREQFEVARDECVRYLRADSERGAAFREAAALIARECRQKGREFGYASAAVPALSREEIKVIRDYAVKQLGGPRDRWLRACVDSQRQSDDRALAAAREQQKGREVFPTGMTEGQRAKLIKDEIASRRADLSAAFIRRLERPVVGHDRPDNKRPRDLDKPRTSRGGGSRGGR